METAQNTLGYYILNGGLKGRNFVDLFIPSYKVCLRLPCNIYEVFKLTPHGNCDSIDAEIKYLNGNEARISLDKHYYDPEATPEEIQQFREAEAKSSDLAVKVSS
jgi:hypothetical protein